MQNVLKIELKLIAKNFYFEKISFFLYFII